MSPAWNRSHSQALLTWCSAPGPAVGSATPSRERHLIIRLGKPRATAFLHLLFMPDEGGWTNESQDNGKGGFPPPPGCLGRGRTEQTKSAPLLLHLAVRSHLSVRSHLPVRSHCSHRSDQGGVGSCNRSFVLCSVVFPSSSQLRTASCSLPSLLSTAAKPIASTAAA